MEEIKKISMLGWEDQLGSIAQINSKIDAHKKNIKELEKQKAELEASVKEFLADADEGIANGWTAQYHRSSTHRFDGAGLKKDDPDTYAKYYREFPQRTFRLKKTEPHITDDADGFGEWQ